MDVDEVSKYEGVSLFLPLASLSFTYAIASQKQPALVFGSLLTSYSVFEGFLNYLGRTLRIRVDGVNSTNPNALELYALGERLGYLEGEKASSRHKVDEVFLCTRGHNPPWGDRLFQHLRALSSIRNLITHPKVISSLLPPNEAGWDQSHEELREYAINTWTNDALWKNLIDWGVLSDPTDNKFCRSFSDALLVEPKIAIWGHNIVAETIRVIWGCVKHKETGGQTARFALISGLISRVGTIEDKHIVNASPELLVPCWMR